MNRRGNSFNKNVNSSSVGQRRPIVTNNYVSNQNPTPQRQSPQQQQLAKQQQMLVQKKQQMAQQQKQQQQKQQMVQQKQLQAQKQQELEKQRELELQKQKQLELQRQKEVELQRQKELELQKQKELELQRQKEQELQKQKELELLKQRQIELEKQTQRELEKQRELEQQNKLELEKQRQLELQRQRALNLLKATEIGQMQTPVRPNQKAMRQESGTPCKAAVDGEQDATPVPMDGTMENGIEGKAPRRTWRPRRKLSKYEIQKRRNLKLSKLLQPKNAMAILNEVIKNLTYNVDSSHTRDGYLFKATVTVEDIIHEGVGITKVAAKNNAAERALQYMVRNKKLAHLHNAPPPAEGEEAMDTTTDTDTVDLPLAWQQFASFAVYKLLDAWGEDPNVVRDEVRPVKKPSRKMPANANLMNPLMLLNQMMPQLHYEELPRTNNGYFSTFNYSCNVDGQVFTGTGTSKKVAKRNLAFEICRKILKIEYPPEIYTPSPALNVSNQ